MFCTVSTPGKTCTFSTWSMAYPGCSAHTEHRAQGAPSPGRPLGEVLSAGTGVSICMVLIFPLLSVHCMESSFLALLPRRGHHHGGPLQGNLRLGGVHPDA